MDWKKKFLNLRPWSIQRPEAKLEYDEGDITTTYKNPVWRVYPTGPTKNIKHDPCGYWNGKHLRYFTTLTYPVLVMDGLNNYLDVASGDFRRIDRYYSINYESLNNTVNLSSAEFKSIIITYNWSFESIVNNINFFSGEFSNTERTYDLWPEENVSNIINLFSGDFTDPFIYYTYYKEENVSNIINLFSGDFNVPA